MVKKFTYLSLFATAPHKRFSLQEFQEVFKTPHQTIKKYLDKFVKKRILLEDKRKRFLFYSINLENPMTFDALSICEKLRLQKRLDEDLLLYGFYYDVIPHLDKITLIIFGSATNSSKYNDIDLLAIGKNADIKKLKKTINSFERTYNKTVHFHEAKPRELSEIFIHELINKHIILNNHDSVLRFLHRQIK